MQREIKWGGSREGAGRPAVAVKDKQSHRVMVNLKPEEFQALKRAAGEESLSAFIRRVLLRFLSRQRE